MSIDLSLWSLCNVATKRQGAATLGTPQGAQLFGLGQELGDEC